MENLLVPPITTVTDLFCNDDIDGVSFMHKTNPRKLSGETFDTDDRTKTAARNAAACNALDIVHRLNMGIRSALPAGTIIVLAAGYIDSFASVTTFYLCLWALCHHISWELFPVSKCAKWNQMGPFGEDHHYSPVILLDPYKELTDKYFDEDTVGLDFGFYDGCSTAVTMAKSLFKSLSAQCADEATVWGITIFNCRGYLTKEMILGRGGFDQNMLDIFCDSNGQGIGFFPEADARFKDNGKTFPGESELKHYLFFLRLIHATAKKANKRLIMTYESLGGVNKNVRTVLFICLPRSMDNVPNSILDSIEDKVTNDAAQLWNFWSKVPPAMLASNNGSLLHRYLLPICKSLRARGVFYDTENALYTSRLESLQWLAVAPMPIPRAPVLSVPLQDKKRLRNDLEDNDLENSYKNNQVIVIVDDDVDIDLTKEPHLDEPVVVCKKKKIYRLKPEFRLCCIHPLHKSFDIQKGQCNVCKSKLVLPSSIKGLLY